MEEFDRLCPVDVRLLGTHCKRQHLFGQLLREALVG